MLCAKYNLQSERIFETPCRSSIPSRLGRRCCLRVVYLWGDRDGFIIRHASWPFQPTQFLTLERWRQGIRWPHFSCSTWASSERGSRMNTNGIPKRAATGQAYRGVWGHASPVHFSDFNFLKFPFLGFWVIQTGYLKEFNLDFSPFKIYLFIYEKSDRFSWKVGNRCRSAPEFYCGFLRRLHYLRNKST